MPHVKGTAFLGVHKYFRDKFGDAGVETIKAQLSAEDKDRLFGKPVLPISWVDFGAYTRYQVAADKVFGKGDKQLIVEANSAIARNEINGLYRIFFMLLTPTVIAQKAPALWKQYFNQGSLTLDPVEGKKHSRMIITDFPDIPLEHEYANMGYMAECWRMAGAKNVRTTHPKCIARGDDQCILDFVWD